MQSYHQTAKNEQRILKNSIALTIILALCGITLGLVSGSSSIIFDGVYAFVDSIFSIAALIVARLISLDAQPSIQEKPNFIRRFHHGFWHLEPLLLLINSTSLIGTVFYGFLEAVSTFFSGGSKPHFALALVFALFAMILCVFMGLYEHKKNKEIESDFILIDEKSWFVSAAINAALLLAFSLGVFLESTSYVWATPYIDPMILAIITCCVLPMPVKIMFQALKEILLITPLDKDKQIKEILSNIVKTYGFETAHHYLAEVGRSLIIEVHIILPKNYEVTHLEFFDQIREEISEKIGDAGPDRWFTVSFTTDKKWAL